MTVSAVMVYLETVGTRVPAVLLWLQPGQLHATLKTLRLMMIDIKA